MEDGHNYHFGQMPTRKTKIEDEIYYRLEIGDVIQRFDVWERIPKESDKELNFVPQKFGYAIRWEGQKYNPISDHRGFILWRKEDALE